MPRLTRRQPTCRMHVMHTLIPNSVNARKLEKRLRRLTGQAIQDFNMIGEGDRVMVCLSGGKDSYTLLDILMKLRRIAPVGFDLLAVNLDQKQPAFPAEVLPRYLDGLGIEYHVIEQNTYRVVREKIPDGKNTCGLCSRLRRGALYRFAGEHGVTRIALGHHRDDIIETFFLNLFHGGRMKAMPAKLISDDGKHVVIRPLAYCMESDIGRYAALRGFPIIPCKLCGSQEDMERANIKRMLGDWEREHPGRAASIFSALQTVVPSHLADRQLFDFSTAPPQAPGPSPRLSAAG